MPVTPAAAARCSHPSDLGSYSYYSWLLPRVNSDAPVSGGGHHNHCLTFENKTLPWRWRKEEGRCLSTGGVCFWLLSQRDTVHARWGNHAYTHSLLPFLYLWVWGFTGSHSSTSGSRISYKTAFIHLIAREKGYISIPVENLTKYKTIAGMAAKRWLASLGIKLRIMGDSLDRKQNCLN